MQVSVIIPVYNSAPFLEEAIRSALAQPEVAEVLLIDDGSTDCSLVIAQGIAAEDNRLVVLQHPDKGNHGPGASRNLGLEKATTPYISFLDADDYYLPGRFRKTKAAFAAHPDADGVYECLENFFENEAVKTTFTASVKEVEKITFATSGLDPEQVFNQIINSPVDFISICGLTLKNCSLNRLNLRFETHLLTGEENTLIFNAAWRGRLYPGEIEKPVVMRRVHGANSVFKLDQLYDDRTLFYEQWFKIMLEQQFPKRINRYFLKNRLHYHKRIRPLRAFAPARYLVKGGLLLYFLIGHITQTLPGVALHTRPRVAAQTLPVGGARISS